MILLLSVSCRAQVEALAQDGFTPLHFAAQSGSAACCRLLIAGRAKTNARTTKGQRVSQCAYIHLWAVQGGS
jgi:hypothetical protein